MPGKQMFILIVLAILLIAGIAFGFFNQKVRLGVSGTPSTITSPSRNPNLEDVQQGGYVPTVPKNAKLTEPASELKDPTGEISETQKFFDIGVAKNGFEPSQITIRKNDSVHLNMKAIDGDYDFFIPANHSYQFAKRGETKPLVFNLDKEGVYFFGCRDYCPVNKISGSIIVMP